MEQFEAMLTLCRLTNYEERNKKWMKFFNSFSSSAEGSTSEDLFELDNLDTYAKRIPKQTQQDVTITAQESNVETKNKRVTIKEMTEMPLKEPSTKSRKLAVKYLRENASNYSLVEFLAVIRYIESSEPVFKGFAFKLAELKDEGKQDSKEYEICKETLHDVFYHLNKHMERNALQLYGNYVIWLYHKKREQKAKKNA